MLTKPTDEYKYKYKFQVSLVDSRVSLVSVPAYSPRLYHRSLDRPNSFLLKVFQSVLTVVEVTGMVPIVSEPSWTFGVGIIFSSSTMTF